MTICAAPVTHACRLDVSKTGNPDGNDDAGVWLALQSDQKVQCVHQALQGKISRPVGQGHQVLWAPATWAACCYS